VLSLSAELFLERRGHQLRVRPMKSGIQKAGVADADLADTLSSQKSHEIVTLQTKFLYHQSAIARSDRDLPVSS